MPVAAGVVGNLLHTALSANLHMAPQVCCPALFECPQCFLYLYPGITIFFILTAKLMDDVCYFILWLQGLAG